MRQHRKQQQRHDVGDLDHRVDRGAGGVLVGIADRVSGHRRLVGVGALAADATSPNDRRVPILAGTEVNARRRAMKFTRITANPNQMGGMPCIRGLRIPVAAVIGMVADGMSETEILAAYPDLEREDIPEALRYAADAVRERELPLAAP